MGRARSENGCLRRAVVAYNAFFWVTGPGIVGLGIWLIIALGEYEPVVQRSDFSTPAFMAMAAGGASVLAGLLGCLGGLNQNRQLLVLYSVLMVAVCALEVTSAVLCFLSYDKADADIGSKLDAAVKDYSIIKDVTKTMDSIQTEYSCCGATDYRDWLTAPFSASSVVSLISGDRQVAPQSCCVPHHNETNCNFGNVDGVPLHPILIVQTGCKAALVHWLQRIHLIAGWSTAGVAASMILPLSAVCCLKHALSDYYS